MKSVEYKPHKEELFTFQIQGKGIRAKVRVPGWVAAMLIRYAKENEAKDA